MARLFVLVTVTSLLAIFILACADENKGQSGSQLNASPSERRAAAEPAVAPADQDAYRKSVVGKGFVQETCAYDSDASIADCGERGTFALEPAPTSLDVSCVVGLSGSSPVFVLCTTGKESKFYDLGSLNSPSPAG